MPDRCVCVRLVIDSTNEGRGKGDAEMRSSLVSVDVCVDTLVVCVPACSLLGCSCLVLEGWVSVQWPSGNGPDNENTASPLIFLLCLLLSVCVYIRKLLKVPSIQMVYSTLRDHKRITRVQVGQTLILLCFLFSLFCLQPPPHPIDTDSGICI